MPSSADFAVDIRCLEFRYEATGFCLRVPSLRVRKGERVAIVGPSGSGKTTLLELISGIRKPHPGQVFLNGLDLGRMPESAVRDHRLKHFGLVFQDFELIEYLTVRENILLARVLNRERPTNEDRTRAAELGESTGLRDKLDRFPSLLSHGEQQRVAVCRALFQQPGIILADEPTANLDDVNRTVVMQTLLHEARKAESTVLVVTHDLMLLQEFDRSFDLASPDDDQVAI